MEDKQLSKAEKEQIKLQKQQDLEAKLVQNLTELQKQGLSQNILNDLKNLFSKTDVAKLAKSEKEETKINYTLFFQQILAQQSQNFDFGNEVFKKLEEKELVDFFDYMNKSFEMVGEGNVDTKFHANFMLKVHEQLINVAGPTIILKNISRKNTLVKRYNNDLEKNTI